MGKAWRRTKAWQKAARLTAQFQVFKEVVGLYMLSHVVTYLDSVPNDQTLDIVATYQANALFLCLLGLPVPPHCCLF